MSKPIEREWRFYLDDMISFAEKALSYTDGFDQQRFVASGLNYDATVRNSGINRRSCNSYSR